MATKLFISAENVKERTSISGSTDNDSIDQKIYYAQITDVVRVLGQSLYDKIYDGLDNNNLSGEYLNIYEKYIIDMQVFYTAFYFTMFNEVKSSNVGNTLLTSERWQPSTKTVQVSEQYKSLAVSIEGNFRKYMEDSDLPEWNYCKKSEDTTNFNAFY